MMNTANAETGRQHRAAIVAFIVEHQAIHGYPPTLREIAAAVGLRSVNTVKHQLDRLKKENRVTWEYALSRTVRVINA